MSSSAPDGSGKPDPERRQSLSKFMSRAKTVLRRDKNKRQSVSGVGDVQPAEQATASSSAAAVQEPTDKADPAPTTSVAPTTEQAKSTTTPALSGEKAEKTAKVKTVASPAIRGADYQERARAMFEKYGYTLEDHEWTRSTEATDRVQKPIRMRIHRQCHRCQTTYGLDKVCVQCGHRRCKKCPRYPAKKSKTSQDAGKMIGVTAATTMEAKPKPVKSKHVLVIPPKPAVQERIRKEVKQAVRRTCHQCQTQFQRAEKTCRNCNHVRCTKCPRHPPKLSKYPDGYPGDAPAEDGDEPSEKKKANRPGAEPGPSRGGHGKALGGLEEKLESVKLKEGVN